jgi:putative ABC transport system permease protein
VGLQTSDRAGESFLTMHFFEFVLKNVFRRKVRTALTTFGVAVAIAAVVSLLSITSGYERSSKEMYNNRGVDLVVVRAGVANRSTSTLDESAAKLLRALPGVGRVAPALSEKVSFEAGSLVSVPVNGWPPDSFAFDSLSVIQGRKLQTGDKHSVILGKELASRLKKAIGDKVEIESEPFNVVGIYESANMLDNNAAVISLRDLQELMERSGQVSEFQVALAKDVPNKKAAIVSVRNAIEGMKDDEGTPLGLVAQETEDFINSDNQIRVAHAMAWTTSAIALIVGSIGMLNTMIVSVLERTQEIGILRAIGWRKSRIMRMILAESFSLSFLGCVLGTLLAAVLIRVLLQFPTAKMLVRGDITPEVMLIGLVMSVLVGLVGGAYPALRGASLPPTEALHYE